MTEPAATPNDAGEHPVINLSAVPAEPWDRSRFYVYLWAVAERLFVTNSWQVSSKLRIAVLRAFGATIGQGVIFRPRTRVRFPWHLTVGDRAWIGEGVWISNQIDVTIGHDAVLSQETFVTTGSHAHREDMRLIKRPVTIGDGAWLTTRCIVLGGAVVGRNALVTPGTVVAGVVPENAIFGAASGPSVIGERFKS